MKLPARFWKEPAFAFLFILTALTGLKTHAQSSTMLIPANRIGYISEPHPDSAFINMKEVLAKHQQSGNRIGQATCLQQMGQLLFHLGNFSQAVDHLLQADKIFRSDNNAALLAANLNILGTVYYYNQQREKASQQFQEALKIYQERQNVSGIADTYGLIGHMYEKQLDYDSAYYFQRHALSFAQTAKDTAVMAGIYENIGSIYEDKERYDSAQFYFLLSLDAYKKLDKVVDQIGVINNLGDIWSKTGQFTKGMVYARQAAEMAAANGEKYQLQSAYRDIAQNFVGLKQMDSAYIYLEKSRALVQSIYSQENSYQISVLQTLYDTERKNAEILHLNAVRRINNLLIWSVVVVLMLIGVLAALVINRQKMKIKNERAVNEGNKKIFETQKGLMESELKRQQLEEASLKQQLDLKGRELSSHILHLIQKNEVMEDLKQGLTDIIKDEKRDQKKQVRQLLQKINASFTQDSYWDQFRLIFDQVHPRFVTNLQQLCPTLTAGELRLLALVKMNLAYGDMATLLGITPDSLRVMRYRVKKKLSLSQEGSLTAFVRLV